MTGEERRIGFQGDGFRQDASTALPHPEEMKATVNLDVGRWFSLSATVRATPASLISVAMLVSAILIPVLRMARRQ